VIEAASAAGLLVACLALGIGYLIGSIPLTAAGARGAGPGWAFLAVTGDVAKGVIAVALGIVTVSWAIGWIAGIGAVLGAARPIVRRTPRGDGLATFVGAAAALSPPAAAVGVVLGLLVLGAGRLTGRDGTAAAVVAGLLAYPAVFAVLQPDAARLAALIGLYLVATLALLAARGR